MGRIVLVQRVQKRELGFLRGTESSSVCDTKTAGSGQQESALETKAWVPGEDPLTLSMSMDLILRIVESHRKGAGKEVSQSDWHFRKLTRAVEQKMNRKGKTRGWEASEEAAMIQGRIREVSMKMEVGRAGP